MSCIRTLWVDTTALPPQEVNYAKICPIVKKRIEDRCGARCVERAEQAEFVLRFELDADVPAEGFRLADLAGEKRGIVVSGGEFLALLYGAGQFLHKSRYTPEGLIPTDWRGQSVPQNEKRLIFFAQHFHNWYQRCTADEIREHIEDLVLWGINGVVSVFSCLNLTGWDDPNLPEMANLVRRTLGTAREMGLKVGIEYSNVDFMNPVKELRADYKYLSSHTGNLLCPSTEEGFARYQWMLSGILDQLDEIGGLDFITIWSYDEGGCCCDKCWPWGGRGFYNMAHRISKYIRQRCPGIEIWLATWYFGRKEIQKDEWPMMYQRLQEDAAKGDNWVDYLLLETRDDYKAVHYPAIHGQPTEHTKLLTFPDVSMVGVTPWGGFGANCTPELLKRWEKPFENCCSGGYLYTEGIFDDMNKVIQLGMYWDRSRPWQETMTDYCRYELQGVDPEQFIRLINLIESSHTLTNRMDRKPSPSEYYEQAWELAEQMNGKLPQTTRDCWRWRILYIRAYLDLVRYRKCAEDGWPLENILKGSMHFWRKYMAHDPRAQDYLLELIHIYKAHEEDDFSKYAYHYYVRPQRYEGTDWSVVPVKNGMF